jgi:hypothetical protein
MQICVITADSGSGISCPYSEAVPIGIATQQLIPDPLNSLIGRISTMDQGSVLVMSEKGFNKPTQPEVVPSKLY